MSAACNKGQPLIEDGTYIKVRKANHKFSKNMFFKVYTSPKSNSKFIDKLLPTIKKQNIYLVPMRVCLISVTNIGVGFVRGSATVINVACLPAFTASLAGHDSSLVKKTSQKIGKYS